MFIFNTTYQTEVNDKENLLIYLHEKYIPEAQKSGVMKNARMSRIVSNQEDGSESYCVQFEVDDMAQLHKWYSTEGVKFNNDLLKLFDKRVLGFPTIMEVIE